MSVRATLEDIPLLSEPEVEWQLKAGVNPHEGVFAVRPQDADTLLSGGLRPVTLKIDDDNGRTVSIQNLYVLTREPQDNPFVAKVLVVDRRWFWSHIHISRAFNVRRVVGSKRRRSPGTPPELDPLTPLIAYHPASLDNEALWTAERALQNILTHVLSAESKATGVLANWRIDSSIGSELRNLPLEDVELEESGENALARILAYLPEARVKVTARGDVVVYRAVDGADAAYLQSTGPEIVGMGHTSLLVNSRIRPSKIHFLFAREHELRFDFEEGQSRTEQYANIPGDDEDGRFIDNVLPVPDFNLDLGSGKTVDQGTWIALAEAFDAWGSPPRMSHLSNAARWFAGLRRVMVPYLDLWTPIGLSGVRDPDADWMGRISAIQEHYRRTFRINPRWMARIAQLKATLLATIDPSQGTRAPALVWADYSRVATQRSLWKDILEDDAFVYSMNQKCYPTTGQLADGRPAPAKLQVVDSDQGIISFAFLPDPLGIYQTTVPGMMTLGETTESSDGRPKEAGPTADIDDISRPISFNAISVRHEAPQLSSPYKVAVLLTAVPANLNSNRNIYLYRVTKSPSDVAKFLPASARAGLEAANGPELEVKVNPSIETARVGWTDSAAGDIEASFGLRGDVTPNIDPLVINKSADNQGGASLDAISTALAAQVYASFTDRYQGARGAPLQAGAEPAGYVENVSHRVSPQGAAVTGIQWPQKLAQIDVFSLLPDSTRRIVLRLAPSPMKVNA